MWIIIHVSFFVGFEVFLGYYSEDIFVYNLAEK